jgi:hypothetical protein
MLDREVAAARLAIARKDLEWMLAEAALDVGGIVDPTPTCDLASAGLALARGDLFGAGLSLLGVVPYVGDAIGKTAKGARLLAQIAETKREIETLVHMMADRPVRASSRNGVALTDGGAAKLGRDLKLPGWATQFDAWRGKRVLDAGAGGGSFVRELRQNGVEAYAVDITADTFKKAGIRNNDHFVQAIADKLPMANKTFDAACSNWSVFYYYERRDGDALTTKYLGELTRVVKSGGEIRLFGVDPRAAAVIGRSPSVRIEQATQEVSGVVPVIKLRVL